jgi:molybdopterin molybdotransferase
MPTQLTPVDDALTHLLAQVFPTPPKEQVALTDGLGRVLAHDLRATLAVPAFDNSAMDGYAVRCADCCTRGSMLQVTQTIAAGHTGAALQSGTAARIFTGAPLPPGADAVVMQENARRESEQVQILEIPRQGENIRRAGHDIAGGGVVLAAGHRLVPQDLGLVGSLGALSVEVFRPLTVALINTGDEVIQQGQRLRPGQLYDSNSHTLAGLLKQIGMNVIRLGIVSDDRRATIEALRDAAGKADCVITTGGVSVGDADHVKQAVEALGTLSLWKLAIKPGKPFSFGHIGVVPFFGLPGNPVAVFITFVILVQPFLLRLQGAAKYLPQPLKARADFVITEAGTRQEYLRVRLLRGRDGFPVVQLFADQSSSVLTSLSWADGLAVVPVGTEVNVGDWLDYLPFKGVA